MAVGAEEAFGVGGEGYMLGEPEDGQHDALDATGVGRYLVETIIDDDAVAGVVDGEVARQRHTLHVDEFVEEALASVFIHVEILYGMGDGLAQPVGVGDEVGEVDGVASFQINGQEAS